MKIDVITLTIVVITMIFYQNIIKSKMFFVKKLFTQAKIIVYDEIFVIQSQLFIVTKIYF